MKDEIKEIFELYERQANNSELSILIKTLKEWYFEKEDYKSRIDKALDYIEIIDNRNSYIDISELRYVYEILKGEDNEQ